ncbi:MULTISPECIES: GNAT family N-acetyltransferase [Modicisalibacter]|uniref:GNAT family N-acetyltransferase n=1 Tax=Modicisalibacter TaxID=574347 RepID=UPI00100B37F6|nr:MULTISPECIES: GNAT family N-acetyltransferase [Halomonadaceae]MBZ9560127.1 GNAT family N-acetyltransferase [Modicisalibacter sp. R2A 31.J]MBZ9576035.1 GNAT family N-acetyltransferase [Modicisalibacter sp. MOD 31.J]
MDIHLRMATESDLDIVEPYVRAYHEFEGICGDETYSPSSIRPLLGDSELGRLWIIDWDSQPIGYIAVCFVHSIEFGGREATIDEFFIVREKRGMGIGKIILNRVKQALAALGVRALSLEVARNNEQAQRLYRSAGFAARERYVLMSAPC